MKRIANNIPSGQGPANIGRSPQKFSSDKRSGGIKTSILETIGKTPVVRLNNIGPSHASIFVKLEAFNPLGSVKDRIALRMIEAAEASGDLKPGQTIVEATSGNTGLGLAMVCAQKGYPLVIVMAENFSTERRRLMRFLGAKVVLTPASDKGSGMLAKAQELAEENGWFLTEQFANSTNRDAHAETTAVEIVEDFEGLRLDYWVSGFGTGGTLAGVASVLREKRPETKIVVAEPDNAAMLGSGSDNDPVTQTHPRFRPHPMQGLSPDFLSRFVTEAKADGMIDDVLGVSGDDAIVTAHMLASREGILAGISGGATVAAAIKLAESAPVGANILAMLPDTGERYLSTPLFSAIDDDMNAEEMSISRSTPGYRFDKKPAKAEAAEPVAQPDPTVKASDFVEGQLDDEELPVVMFSLEWCEFSWSVRNFFAACGIPFKSVDLDAASFEGGQDFASDVRTALHERTGAPTIPQIFVAGQLIGGATETFDAYNDKSLHKLLKKANVEFKPDKVKDAYEFLPTWLQKR